MSDRLALLADARLPGDARIMAMLVLEMGEGWHEVSHDQFRALLPDGPSDETIRRHLRRLESAGWIEANKKTGRRPPQYRVRTREDAGAFGGFRDALVSSLPLSHVGDTDSGPHPRGAEESYAHTHVGQKGVSPTPVGGKAPVVVVEEEVVGEVGETREAFDIDEKVQDLLDREESDVVGLRDSMVDYLTDRVQTDRQWGYVSSIRSWFDGSPSAPRGLHELEPLEQRKLLASALNELLQTDEVSEFRSARGKVGEISTLRTKVEYLLRRMKRPADPGSSGTEKPSRRKSPLPDPEVSHA